MTQPGSSVSLVRRPDEGSSRLVVLRGTVVGRARPDGRVLVRVGGRNQTAWAPGRGEDRRHRGTPMALLRGRTYVVDEAREALLGAQSAEATQEAPCP